MGVRGLYTFISKDSRAYSMFDLVKEAKARNGIEILIDFNAFQRTVAEIISRKMAQDYDNKYLLFSSGEYDIFSEAFSEFHKIFRDIGIKLVWIIDGPKGVDESAITMKTETWSKRDEQDILHLNDVLLGCLTKTPPRNLNNLGPMLGFELTVESLQKCGADIIQLLQGGSDEFIALEFKKRKSFAIISGDTDFLIFRGCSVIFPNLMTLRYGNDFLNLPFIDKENPRKIFKTPDSFQCPVIIQEKMFQIFNFTNHDQIVALSIINGNDNTEDYSQKLQFYLDIIKKPNRHAHVSEIGKYIVKNRVTAENIFRLPGMNLFLNEYPQGRESIRLCYQFYTLEIYNENNENALITFDPSVATDTLTDFFQEKLSKSEISKKIYSAHKGIFYDAIIMERPNVDCPSNSSLMSYIRSKIYSCVLDTKLHKVKERRSRKPSLEYEIQIKHASFKTNKIKAKPENESDRNDSIIYGVDLFEEIWSHLEPKSLNFFKKFGLEKGFICYMLRYFYKLTKGKNLKVTEVEFKALFITIFYQYGVSQGIEFNTKLKRDIFLGMKICPMEKCLIIYSWFMNIYYTGKYLSGGAFNLTGDFPSIEKLMSASVLYSFYEYFMNDTNKRIDHLEDTIVESIKNLGKLVLEHYSDQYDAVTAQ